MHPDFNPPARDPKITGRKSTITGLFFVTVTPSVSPSDDEVDHALEVLGMKRGACLCAYCGDAKTEWDHFRPIVKNRQPTGYITEIANLVPSCGKCNQSKGNKDWHQWINGTAQLCPRVRRPAGLEERISRLKAYEVWRKPIKIDYANLFGKEDWANHLNRLERILQLMQEAENDAMKLRDIARRHLERNHNSD